LPSSRIYLFSRVSCPEVGGLTIFINIIAGYSDLGDFMPGGRGIKYFYE
jgi:hypothetical protein